jgi:hypothetical protein
MKKTNITYWIFTGLFCFMMLGSAIPDILSAQVAVDGMHGELGYPVYFIPFVGTAKLLGVIALLMPGFPRIKEWAYAGLAFDLLGATYSIIAAGGAPVQYIPMILPLSLGTLSYVFYHKRLRAKKALAALSSSVIDVRAVA